MTAGNGGHRKRDRIFPGNADPGRNKGLTSDLPGLTVNVAKLLN